MSINSEKSVLLIGAGQMAIEYSKVLIAMQIPFITVGRGEKSAQIFMQKTNLPIEIGGVDNWLEKTEDYPKYSIIAVNGTELGNVTRSILRHKFKNILLEKPGGLNIADIESVNNESKKNNAEVLIAYNRHFYASTIKAKEIIKEDGGVSSFTFDFTELIHKIVIKKDFEIRTERILHNSSHVIDLAFYLCGEPEKFTCYTAGGFDWHPDGSIFTGSGKTKSGVLFAYHSNWDAPGRWGLEICTRNRRLIFRPLEKLKIQQKGSMDVEELHIDDKLDFEFKPGLYRQVYAFLNDDTRNFTNIQQQVQHLKLYNMIIKGTA